MRRLGYRFFSGAILLGWMTVIFWFSAQPATESQEMSGSLAYRVVQIGVDVFDMEIAQADMQIWAELLDLPIRKGAHMAEYAVCAVLVASCILGYKTWSRQASLLAFGITVCYATTDEIHQLFVPGRAGRFSDVCIDSIGAAIGLLLFAIILKIMDKHCEK